MLLIDFCSAPVELHGLLRAAVLLGEVVQRGELQELHGLLVLLMLYSVEEPGDQKKHDQQDQTHVGLGHVADVVLAGDLEVVLQSSSGCGVIIISVIL